MIFYFTWIVWTWNISAWMIYSQKKIKTRFSKNLGLEQSWKNKPGVWFFCFCIIFNLGLLFQTLDLTKTKVLLNPSLKWFVYSIVCKFLIIISTRKIGLNIIIKASSKENTILRKCEVLCIYFVCIKS